MGLTAPEQALLAHDWYKLLTPIQMTAYVRYQYIYLKDNALDWDSPTHARRRPTWDGGKDNYGVRRTSVWGEIAKRIEMFDAVPGMWVHAHFSPAAEVRLNPVTSGLPDIRPSFLHSAASPAIYSRHCKIMPEIIVDQFELAGRTIHARMVTTNPLRLSKEDQNLYVLCDENYVSATPFFRHAFAAAAECYDAVETYLWQAALEYEVHQISYDSVVASNGEQWWLTDNLKAAVIEIRKHWRDYNG